jgi:Lon protease-like protein
MANLSAILSSLPPLPDALPVMVLGECYHFPGTMLPLYIFEQRYRNMLDYALSTSRMFCVGVKKDPHDESECPEVYPYATAAMIQSSVKQEDGTSQVMLMGMKRIQLSGWSMQDGFRLAKIKEVPTEYAPIQEMTQWHLRAMSKVMEMIDTGSESAQRLLNMLDECADAELTCDVLTYHLVRGRRVIRQSLSEPSLEVRYELLFNELARLGASA